MATTVQELNAASESPMPFSRVLRAYMLEVKYDTLHALRTPAMAVPFLVIPVLVYTLFGVFMVSGGPAEQRVGPGDRQLSFRRILHLLSVDAGHLQRRDSRTRA